MKRELKWEQLVKWEKRVDQWEHDFYLREESNGKWEDSLVEREADILKKELEMRENDQLYQCDLRREMQVC